MLPTARIDSEAARWSSYDGFYDLTDIKPGRYTLRVAKRQAAHRSLAATPSIELGIAPGGTVLDGVNLSLNVE